MTLGQDVQRCYLIITRLHFSVCSTQVWPSDHDCRGGAEAPEGPLHEWPPLRSVLPGLLGVVGQTGTAVLNVPVSVRWFPHSGGPPPQCAAGRPRCVGLRSHTPQLPLLRVQCFGLVLCISVLLLLTRRTSTPSVSSVCPWQLFPSWAFF